jgi:hypothetical protein
VKGQAVECLTAEAVQGASLALQSVDNVKGSDGLPASVLGVGDCIPDHILQEYLQHTPGLLVDEARDTLNTSTASQTPDGGLGDACSSGAEDVRLLLCQEQPGDKSDLSHLYFLIRPLNVCKSQQRRLAWQTVADKVWCQTPC